MKRWTHYEVAARYRKLLVPILDCASEDDIPSDPWDNIIHTFAQVWERTSARYWLEVSSEVLNKEIVTDIANRL